MTEFEEELQDKIEGYAWVVRDEDALGQMRGRPKMTDEEFNARLTELCKYIL